MQIPTFHDVNVYGYVFAEDKEVADEIHEWSNTLVDL